MRSSSARKKFIRKYYWDQHLWSKCDGSKIEWGSEAECPAAETDVLADITMGSEACRAFGVVLKLAKGPRLCICLFIGY